jgi:lantibiotic modifying enzyme
LFHGYLAAANGDERSRESAEARLAKAVEHAGEGSLSASFFTGLAGIAWTNQHLEELLTGGAMANLNEEIDAALDDLLRTSPWPWAYDLTYGLAGAGCYAVDHPNREIARCLIDLIVDRLDELAQESAEGLAWWTSPTLMARQAAERFPDGHFDTGVAHGIPGVIGMLGRVCAAGLATAKSQRLLSSAVAWLLANRRPDDGGSTFGRYVTGFEKHNCRSAWCYGDPGIAAALLSASRATGELSWEHEAIAVALKDCARPRPDMEVVDATLCHGAAGLGHLYNRMYQATGEETFARVARDWFEAVLNMREPGEGYEAWWPSEGTWARASGLLDGVAGIGLALIAATSSLEPRWDRPLLLPSRSSGALA